MTEKQLRIKVSAALLQLKDAAEASNREISRDLHIPDYTIGKLINGTASYRAMFDVLDRLGYEIEIKRKNA